MDLFPQAKRLQYFIRKVIQLGVDHISAFKCYSLTQHLIRQYPNALALYSMEHITLLEYQASNTKALTIMVMQYW